MVEEDRKKTGRKTTSYFIQRPNENRKRFSIHAKTPEGRSPKIDHEIIDTLNSAYLKGEITKESVEIQLKTFIDTHLKEKKPDKPFNSENAEILSRYWRKYYEHKKIADKESAYNRLRRSVEAVGTLSLRSASEEQLQEAVDLASDQRRVVEALSSLLDYTGRHDVVLQKEPKKRTKVSYLSQPEFMKVRPFIQEENIRLFADISFGTGARQGEGFAIEKYNTFTKHVFIEEQIKRNKQPGDTKNRRSRRAPVISHFIDAVLKWIELPNMTKLELRNQRFAEIFQKAVTEAGIDKKITWHDLRHSYAVHLLSKGVSMTLVAQALGDSIQVCQEYYAGFELSDESLMIVSSLI